MSKNLFKMPKMLSLSLEPLPETVKHLEVLKRIESDIETNRLAEKAKDLIDEFHLKLIDDCLRKASAELSWDGLFEAFLADDKDAIKAERRKMMNKLTDIFQSIPEFEYATTTTPSRLMQEKLLVEHTGEPALQIQATYLQQFHNQRLKLYGDKEGSISYRIVFDNFYIYVTNIIAWKKFTERCPEQAAAFLSRVKGENIMEDIDGLFTAEGYRHLLDQKGIKLYNTVINGFTDSEGILHPGLSKMIYDLKTGKETRNLLKKKEWPDLRKLKKMILQDTGESTSFFPKRFNSDAEMLENIELFCRKMLSDEIMNPIKRVLDSIRTCSVSPEDIILFKDRTGEISNTVYGKWDAIEKGIEQYAEKTFAKKKDAKAFKAEPLISVDAIRDIMKMNGRTEDILAYWTELDPERDVRRLLHETQTLKRSLDGKEIKNAKELTRGLESAFNNLSKTAARVKMLLGGKISKKETFENPTFRWAEDEITFFGKECHFLLCNSRSWCTRKPYDTRKMALNFGFPAFGGGFAESVITSKGCMIFRKGKEYFLGVLNSDDKPEPEEIYDNKDESSQMYALYSYSLRAMAISTILFSEKNRKLFECVGLDDSIREGYEKKLYRDDPEFLKKFIAFTMNALKVYPTWKGIAWSLGRPEDYTSWKQFSDMVAEQAVTVEMRKCNESALNTMVSDGRIFLFKITSHGMKKYEKGLPTKDKMSEFFIRAVENIFNEGETKVNLLSNCSVYYRPASVKTPFVHRKGDILVDKKDRNGNPIPGKLYKEIFHYYAFKGIGRDELSQEAKDLIDSGLVITKKARYDIVKDNRFTHDAYMLQIPVIVNADASISLDTEKDVNNALKTLNNEADETYEKYGNVIGVTRGANHLVSYCVVNRDRGVIEEGDFDVVNERDSKGLVTESLNYRTKLDQINAAREAKEKTWQEANTTASLQDGYLKCVLRSVMDLAEKHNAIIAIEDMSNEMCAKSIFSRIKDKSYRKFEALLLDSLSCYIPDKLNPGDIRQYTVGNLGAKKNKGQNGRVVFVPTARLQNTDPKTGFCNLFGQVGSLETKSDITSFFAKFDSIEVKGDAIECTFHYSKFSVKDLRWMKDDWKIRIEGDRYSYELDENGKRNRKKLVIRQPAREMICIAKEKGMELKDMLTDKEQKADDLRALKSLFFLGLKTRLCSYQNGREMDVFVSAACDDEDNTFTSGLTPGYPRFTDTVLAYNIAKMYGRD